MNKTELYNSDYYNNSDWSSYMDDPFRINGYISAIQQIGARHILDVGCGKNNLVDALRDRGYDAIGIDFSPDSNADLLMDATDLHFFKDRSYDLAISTDFLEHLEYEEIHKAISEMRRVAIQQAHVICFKESHTKEHDIYHPTLESREWWLNEFSKHLLGLVGEIEVRWHVQNLAGAKRINGFYMMVF